MLVYKTVISNHEAGKYNISWQIHLSIRLSDTLRRNTLMKLPKKCPNICEVCLCHVWIWLLRWKNVLACPIFCSAICFCLLSRAITATLVNKVQPKILRPNSTVHWRSLTIFRIHYFFNLKSCRGTAKWTTAVRYELGWQTALVCLFVIFYFREQSSF